MSTKRIVSAWMALAALMVANGVLRVGILQLLMSARAADVTSAILGMVVVVGASRPLLANHPVQSTSEAYRISAIWLGLTILFEAALGLIVGRTWSSMADAYALWRGSLWPLVLLCVAAAPFIWLPRPVAPVHETAP